METQLGSWFIAFYKINSGLGLLISKSYGSYVTVANDDRGFAFPDYKFPSSKSNCTILNKWHVISVTWSYRKNLSNCWSNGEKLMTFNAGNAKGTDHCIIGDIGKTIIKSHLIGCIGEIIGSPSGEPMFSLCRKWRKFAGHCKVT